MEHIKKLGKVYFKRKEGFKIERFGKSRATESFKDIVVCVSLVGREFEILRFPENNISEDDFKFMEKLFFSGFLSQKQLIEFLEDREYIEKRGKEDE